MSNANDNLPNVRYEDLLRAVGHYLDQHGYTDVLVTMLPDGVLVKGAIVDNTADAPRERVASVTFSNAELVELLTESERRRSAADGR